LIRVKSTQYTMMVSSAKPPSQIIEIRLQRNFFFSIKRRHTIFSRDWSSDVCSSDLLRAQLNDYLARMLPENPDKKEFDKAVVRTIIKFPQYIDYFIKLKEENGDQAVKLSELKVNETEYLFIQKVKELVSSLEKDTKFYDQPSNSLDEAYQRVIFLKQMTENNDGYRFFYVKGNPIKREQDLQLLFKLTWFASKYDVNAEVHNGRGPVDFKISNGSNDKSLVEFKLASNKK